MAESVRDRYRQLEFVVVELLLVGGFEGDVVQRLVVELEEVEQLVRAVKSLVV